MLKDKEIIGQEVRLKGEGEGKTARNRTRQRKERGGGNRGQEEKGERQNEGMINQILRRGCNNN